MLHNYTLLLSCCDKFLWMTLIEKVDLKDGHYGIKAVSSDSIISTVSDRYCLVPNERIFKPFVETFGIDKLKKFYSYGRQKHYFAEFET